MLGEGRSVRKPRYSCGHRDNFWESVLPSRHVSPQGLNSGGQVGGQHLHLLSHCSVPLVSESDTDHQARVAKAFTPEPSLPSPPGYFI